MWHPVLQMWHLSLRLWHKTNDDLDHGRIHMGHPVSMSNLLYPLHNEVVGGYIGFTPSVCPSVRPASRVRSVVPKVVVGSISYLYILSSNFRRCVACRVSYQIRIFGNFLKLVTLLTLGSWKINQHCWPFHGSGVIAAPQIISLISFCTGMHHEYFFEVIIVLSCSPFMF